MPGASPRLSKSEKTLAKRKKKGAVNPPPHCIEACEVPSEMTRPVKTIKPPLVLTLEGQQEKHDAKKRTGTAPALWSDQSNNTGDKGTRPPPVRHELEKSDSEDSDIPLAQLHVKHNRLPTDARAKSREGEPLPSKKRRSTKTKTLPAGNDASDEAPSLTEVKLAAHSPPRTKRARARIIAGGVGEARIPQEKSAPANAPRKRKERAKPMTDTHKGEKELEHEPPRKRRRADPVVRYTRFFLNISLFVFGLMLGSRRSKTDEEITRSTREVSKVMIDRVRLSFWSFGRVWMW
jgi:hypothetical protein